MEHSENEPNKTVWVIYVYDLAEAGSHCAVDIYAVYSNEMAARLDWANLMLDTDKEEGVEFYIETAILED